MASTATPELDKSDQHVQRLAGAAKASKGKLRTGVVAAHSGIGTKSSIPTRFETILNAGNRERNGFGRRTYRFDEPENELPGPGSYQQSRSILSQSKLSISKKGFSGFAPPVGLKPKSSRQAVPGPGAYGPDTVPMDPAATLKQNVGGDKTHAVFATPTPKPVLRLSRPATEPVGPGHYFTGPNTTLTSPCTAMTSKFDFRAAEERQKSRVSSIGPGAYLQEQDVGMNVKDPLRPSHFSLSGTNRFTSPASHEISKNRKLATALPPILAISADVDRLHVPEVVKEVREKNFRPTLRQPHTSTSVTKPSFMFSETNLDRFGRPIIRYTAPPSDSLGPGSYDFEQQPKRMLISSSWALSGSTRDEMKDHYLPPGPAYYSPPPPASRVSHRIGDTSNWAV